MLGKIIGGIAGANLSRSVAGGSGAGGAILGAGAVALARRLGPLGLVAAAAGAWALKRRSERQDRAASSPR